MRVTVIGAAGAMGQWFTHYLNRRGFSLTVSDCNVSACKKLALEVNATFVERNQDAVSRAQMVIIAVPMNVAVKVVEEVRPHLQKDSILCEISTFKQQVFGVLQSLKANQVRALCVHPLFGPGASASGARMAHISMGDEKSEMDLLRSFFPDMRIYTVDVRTHDRAMALAVSLPYLLNLILAAVLRYEDIRLLQDLTGPTGLLQQTVMGAVVYQSPDLHFQLYQSEIFRSEILPAVLKATEEATMLVKARDEVGFKEYYRGLRQDISGAVDLKHLYERMYKILDTLQNNQNHQKRDMCL